VNGKRVDIPSYRVRAGDKLGVRSAEKSRKIVTEALEFNRSQTVPDWIAVDNTALEATVQSLPTREHFMHPIQLQMIIELCSR
jgi:small subunit ribosomal protein S4